MRLIDADELKKTLKSNCKPELCHDYNTAWCESCCRTNDFEDLIDNAPTVDINKLILIVAKRSGKREMMLNALRPQGTWIGRIDTEWHFECNQCKGLSPWKAQFCGVCGADMRGGAE